MFKIHSLSQIGELIHLSFLVSRVKPSEQILSGDDASKFSISRMEHRNVSHVELPHVVNALADVVGGHHHHWVLDQVGSQVDHGVLVVLTDLGVFVCDRQILAPEVTSEIGPVQDFLIWGWRIKLDVIVAGEILLNL